MTLRLEAVTVAFRRRSLFAPVTLQLEAGQQATLLGPNGSGKSTLLKICAGLMNQSTGFVDAPAVAFVSQDAPVYPDLTIQEHLDFALAAHGRISAPGMLDDVGLAKLALQPANVLSRGQRQRLHLAIAFASGAPLLLLDEPFTGLDAEGEAWLTRQLTETTATVLLAVHESHHMRGVAVRLEEP